MSGKVLPLFPDVAPPRAPAPSPEPRPSRMELAVAFVTGHPGTTMHGVVGHVVDALRRASGRASYKQAQAVVERVIMHRLVRLEGERLYPWDRQRFAFAEALERAALAAPDVVRYAETLTLAQAAWRHAGDENRARIIGMFPFTRAGNRANEATG